MGTGARKLSWSTAAVTTGSRAWRKAASEAQRSVHCMMVPPKAVPWTLAWPGMTRWVVSTREAAAGTAAARGGRGVAMAGREHSMFRLPFGATSHAARRPPHRYARDPLSKLYGAYRTCYTPKTPGEVWDGDRRRPNRPGDHPRVRHRAAQDRPRLAPRAGGLLVRHQRRLARPLPPARAPPHRHQLRAAVAALREVQGGAPRLRHAEDLEGAGAGRGLRPAHEARSPGSTRRRSRRACRPRTPASSCPTPRRPTSRSW